jgi:hypothetical protein
MEETHPRLQNRAGGPNFNIPAGGTQVPSSPPPNTVIPNKITFSPNASRPIDICADITIFVLGLFVMVS